MDLSVGMEADMDVSCVTVFLFCFAFLLCSSRMGIAFSVVHYKGVAVVSCFQSVILVIFQFPLKLGLTDGHVVHTQMGAYSVSS